MDLLFRQMYIESSPRIHLLICQVGISYICTRTIGRIFKCVGLNANSNILHYVLGSLQFKSTGITPGFNISFGNHLGKSTVGYLTYSSAWKLSEYNDVSTSIIIGAQTRMNVFTIPRYATSN